MARFGDGLGTGGDMIAAARAAVESAVGSLAEPPDLVTVFVSGVDPDTMAEVAEYVWLESAGRCVIGCGAGGVIGGGRGVEGEPAVAVFAAQLPDIPLRTFHLRTVQSEGGMSVNGMPDRAADDTAAVLLADPYTFPAEGFVSRTNDLLPGLAVVGGLASAGGGPGSTRLFLDGTVIDRGAVGVLLGGAVRVRTLVSQGCRPVGAAMVVTRCDGNVVLELAGRPALDRLREVLDGMDERDRDLFAAAPQVGVAVNEYAEELRQGDFLIRGVLGVDEARDGLAIGELVDVGQTLRFQVRDAAAAAADLRGLLTGIGDPEGALLFSCNGRGAGMFGTADHDVALVRQMLDPIAVAGFFAGGELGPVSGRNHLHAFTASMLTFDAP